MMQISDYNNDKEYSNNNIHRMINNKEYINNTRAIEKINMKPEGLSKNIGIHNYIFIYILLYRIHAISSLCIVFKI